MSSMFYEALVVNYASRIVHNDAWKCYDSVLQSSHTSYMV